MYIFNTDLKEYYKIPKVLNSASDQLPKSATEYIKLAYYKDW